MLQVDPTVDLQATYKSANQLLTQMDKMQEDRKSKGKPAHHIGKGVTISLNSRMQKAYLQISFPGGQTGALTGAPTLGVATGAVSRGG
jgi:hypothetical protein